MIIEFLEKLHNQSMNPPPLYPEEEDDEDECECETPIKTKQEVVEEREDIKSILHEIYSAKKGKAPKHWIEEDVLERMQDRYYRNLRQEFFGELS